MMANLDTAPEVNLDTSMGAFTIEVYTLLSFPPSFHASLSFIVMVDLKNCLFFFFFQSSVAALLQACSQDLQELHGAGQTGLLR